MSRLSPWNRRLMPCVLSALGAIRGTAQDVVVSTRRDVQWQARLATVADFSDGPTAGRFSETEPGSRERAGHARRTGGVTGFKPRFVRTGDERADLWDRHDVAILGDGDWTRKRRVFVERQARYRRDHEEV